MIVSIVSIRQISHYFAFGEVGFVLKCLVTTRSAGSFNWTISSDALVECCPVSARTFIKKQKDTYIRSSVSYIIEEFARTCCCKNHRHRIVPSSSRIGTYQFHPHLSRAPYEKGTATQNYHENSMKGILSLSELRR